MTATALAVRPADEGEIDYVERLLAASGLPTADVRDGAISFYLAELDGEPVGVGGIEPHGTAGLLRSIAIEPAHRGRGHGATLVDRLEAAAAGLGIEELYLLTTDAAGFFDRLGYEPVDRGTAPAGIRDSTEFTELCPESATCMRAPVDR